MRFLLAGLFLLLGDSLLQAQLPPPAPLRPPPVQFQLFLETQQAEALRFGQQLVEVANEVMENYVRPLARADLIHAALTGLYDAARLPVPPTLRAEVERAQADRSEGDSELLKLLIRVREEIGNPEPLQGSGAFLAGVRGMTRLLDLHSGIITAEELRRGRNLDRIFGLGMDLTEAGVEGPVRVREVFPGGPAQQAGLRPGDEITDVNGESAQRSLPLRLWLGRSVDQTAAPKAYGELTLTLRRNGIPKPWQVKLKPEEFRPETILGVIRQDNNAWDWWLDRSRKLAYVRISQLTVGTSQELRQVLEQLKAEDLRGLVLDLRWCPPGGLLEEARIVAETFLGEGTVATIKSRRYGDETYRSAPDESKLLNFPMVVLVNEDTAGGTELIAAALQDNGRAAVAGQRTRGKGSVQRGIVLPVPDAGFKLTTGIFYRPNGKNLNRFPDSKSTDDWGVRPDPRLEVRVSPDLNRQLKEWTLLQTLRPGPSREALPLDDSRADPPRYVALQALIEMVK